MSLWLKRQQPIRLYQSLELPYVILEDGIHLCYDNCYGTNKDNSDFNLCFTTQASNIKRINTYFYKFNSFPTILPFEQIISLNDTIIEGKTIKHIASSDSDEKQVIVMKSDYIYSFPGDDLFKINDLFERYDHSFILVGDTIDPQVRLFEDIAEIIPHQQWTRTLIGMVHKIANKPERKYCWTHILPDINLYCYGFKNREELIFARESAALNNISLFWET